MNNEQVEATEKQTIIFLAILLTISHILAVWGWLSFTGILPPVSKAWDYDVTFSNMPYGFAIITPIMDIIGFVTYYKWYRPQRI